MIDRRIDVNISVKLIDLARADRNSIQIRRDLRELLAVVDEEMLIFHLEKMNLMTLLHIKANLENCNRIHDLVENSITPGILVFTSFSLGCLANDLIGNKSLGYMIIYFISIVLICLAMWGVIYFRLFEKIGRHYNNIKIMIAFIDLVIQNNKSKVDNFY